ncbi:hypothetical protein ScPMuIL_005988 [Solemya velum]
MDSGDYTSGIEFGRRASLMKLFQEVDEDASPMSWSCLTPGKWEREEDIEVTPVVATSTAGSSLMDVEENTPEGRPAFRGALFRNKTPRIEEEEDKTPSRKRKRGHRDVRNQRFTRFWSFQVCSNDERCSVKAAVNRLTEEADLVGDGTGTHCLPTIAGKHNDLKSITPETLSDLMQGKYDDVVDQYEILDCRYPYEFEGGHIKGASNVYTKDGVAELLSSPPLSSDKRNVLIFHCEFSSERAPKLCRFLRNKDREMNQDSYPNLTYPEVYILHGGYSNFFESQLELCEPQSYKPMLHRDHADDVRHFRKKSKSWTSGEKHRRFSKLSLRF